MGVAFAMALLGTWFMVTFDMTDTNTAVPMDAKTWRAVLLTTVPSPMRVNGRAFIPVVVTGIMVIEIPNIRTM